ncbi:hypothetical protein [Streptomyces tubercidicus]|uniref:hypothetical protein n=1 Tax=Streptomyces tubercidicus TaxID=47759 RepID=UPI0036851FC6
MPAQRRSVIRTVTVATGALAGLLLPAGAAMAAEPTGPSESRTSIMLPDNGLAGLVEKAGQLPTAGLIGGTAALGVVGTTLAIHRRRHGSHEGRRSQRA